MTSPSPAPEAKRIFPKTTGIMALFRYRQPLSVLVRRDLAVKYQSTTMGYFWSMIEPLGLALIFWFIFGVVFGREGDLPPGVGYPIYIVSGIFAWQWFSSAVNEGSKSLTGQSRLITVMKVPREIFPVGKVFARFADYAMGFPILVGVAILFGGTFGWNMLWLIPALITQAIMLTGMAFIVSAINVLYRDVQRFLTLFTRLLFYSSPIIYPISRVTEALQEHTWVLYAYLANPMVGLFLMHRAAWIPELTPSWWQITSTVTFSVVLLFFGRWIFHRVEPKVLKAL
ncbi:ABC transporter permease [Natronoglycomyces albus]|uniref:Transport permease protein n=1 Tax=Natronoglycomyces albus TaxID=2811108 RepID=A0A895XMT3_9ACTN|nr:ABC transporter permease [Natronoglycomyces albus]QSB05082.1 ABC transporter permease [Natronoglycomyces albus]